MGGAERVRGFLHDPSGFFNRELSATPEPGRDRLAIYVSHDEVHQPLALTDRVNRDDVRVGQPGCGLSLASESLPDVLLKRELRGQHLDRHAPLETLVARTVDHAHTAATDLAFERVRGAQCVGQAAGERLVLGVSHSR